MLFNFGDAPWKFPPRDKSFAGFSGLNAADTVPNEKKGEGVVERKIIANAPQVSWKEFFENNSFQNGDFFIFLHLFTETIHVDRYVWKSQIKSNSQNAFFL